MLNPTVATLKSDIQAKMRGTSLREVKDFYGTSAAASNRMLARIDTQETIRIATLTTPFYDNLNDYALMTDYKRMIDIRPQANRINQPGLSLYSETTPRQFLSRLEANSFSIRWASGIRALRSQRLPAGNVATMDTFDSATSNGSWSAGGDASGLYSETLNYVEGNGALGMNLSGSTGAANIVNTTAAVTDLSQLLYNDASALWVYIPVGTSALFTAFKLRRGSSSSAYKEASVTTKADGTAFSDGWNLLLFQWNTASTTGSPDDTKNTYRYFGIAYGTGTAVTGFLIDNWTDSLGSLYEAEYYSECGFRSSTGSWKYVPTDDSDICCVGPASYEILKAEMMVDITQQIRTGPTRQSDLAEFRLQLNGQPQSRYVKDPPFHGLYADYLRQFPSSAITTSQSYYSFDC